MTAFQESPALPGQFTAADETGTAQLAARLAASARPGDIFLLEGPLGAGKTAFSRAFVRFLSGAPEQDIPSPTFTLLQTYPTPAAEIWHFDLYRLKDPDEIFELGWEDTGDKICLIEWPEKLGPHYPQRMCLVTLTPVKGQPECRIIEIRDDRIKT